MVAEPMLSATLSSFRTVNVPALTVAPPEEKTLAVRVTAAPRVVCVVDGVSVVVVDAATTVSVRTFDVLGENSVGGFHSDSLLG